MNRRSFIKRCVVALGLSVAWPLLPSILDSQKIRFPAVSESWGTIEGVVIGDFRRYPQIYWLDHLRPLTDDEKYVYDLLIGRSSDANSG
ncbi:hypothetical protein LCGC14_2107730 [marine sediment metagenome]|uniref:Uncharacterized protein n=1 Tax=marine sediment metagenome TaxID=412755 RepID=A0A0F9E7Y7_9ZZZZ